MPASGGFLRSDEWIGKEKLREERVRVGLSRRQLAEELGISAEMMRKIENGERNPGLYTARRIQEFFQRPALGGFVEHLILVYPDGQPVALDLASGGYPVRAHRGVYAHVWASEKDRDRYMEMFEKEGFKKATMRVEVIVEGE